MTSLYMAGLQLSKIEFLKNQDAFGQDLSKLARWTCGRGLKIEMFRTTTYNKA